LGVGHLMFLLRWTGPLDRERGSQVGNFGLAVEFLFFLTVLVALLDCCDLMPDEHCADI
jgi:hypothetical protein